MAIVVAAFLFVSARLGMTDDYQCYSDDGCVALLPSPSGTRTVKFKKGDIIGTSGGWIVNPDPSSGWREIDYVGWAVPGLLKDLPRFPEVTIPEDPALLGVLFEYGNIYEAPVVPVADDC